jgi:hypothetical protein
MAVPQTIRNPNLPDPNNPMGGVQAGPAVGVPPVANTMGAPEPAPNFADPNAMASAQFTGAGSDFQNQSDFALQRDFANQRTAALGSDASFDADLRRRADETYAEFERSLNPQWETRAREFEQSLIGRGIDPNSEAGRNARAQFDRSRTDAFSQARRAANADGVALQQQRWQQQFAIDQAENQARMQNMSMGANQMNLDYDRNWRERQFNEDTRRYDQGFGEDTRRYNQGFDNQLGQQDFGMLMQLLGIDQGMAGFNNNAGMQEQNAIYPWMSMIPQGGPAGIDVTSPYGLNMQAQQFNAQQRQQQNNGFWGGLGTLGGMIFSDQRVKDEIRQVGTLHNGLPVYAYRYKWGGPTQLGVMAQDVEQVNPEAVIEVEGIKMVNYDLAVA